MKKLIAIFAIWLLPINAYSTLILGIATKHGFILAADSRLRLLGNSQVCDDEFKIQILPEKLHAAIAFSGSPQMYLFHDTFDLASFKCSTRNNRPTSYDIHKITNDYFNSEFANHEVFSRSNIDLYVDICIKEIQKTDPNILKYFNEIPIMNALLFYYDENSNQSFAYHIGVLVKNGSDFKKLIEGPISFSGSNQSPCIGIGEVKFFHEYVEKSTTHKLSNIATACLNNSIRASDIDLQTGIKISKDVITTTANVNNDKNDVAGVGGPIDIVYIGRSSQNESQKIIIKKIQWKN